MTTETQTIDEIEEKFREQENTFLKSEQCRETLRAFFAKHKEAIKQFRWRAYGWTDTEIEFDDYFYRGRAKEIARAFGADGWTRKANRHTCGSIDWFKELDGCTLIIRGAESISPKLIEQVKI